MIGAVEFLTPQHFRDWLAENHANASEIWVALHKVHTQNPSITWEEGVREALCWGWIDGVKKGGADIWYQRFTPRGPRSKWSERNCKHVEDLIAKGMMQPAGLHQVDKARVDGRWADAYSGPKDMVIPEDFLRELAKIPAAQAQYDTLNRRNLFTIYYQVTSAKKPETRANRIAKLIATLTRGETFH
ncbi:MAG: YdeI/OmpD-associated family protein [Deltaproteobacteria bacterium]